MRTWTDTRTDADAGHAFAPAPWTATGAPQTLYYNGMLVKPQREPEHGAAAAASALAADCRGAMFVMGIPLIFFMIGLLYFVIGLGEELVFRERMQDAADAGAMTGAMVYARGMNLIALLNQLMAALVGLLIMVRMLEAVMTATIFIAGALAWPTAGASLGVVPSVEVAREEANTAYEELKNVINPIVEVLHGLELGIQYGMPAIAELQTIDIITSFDKPIASGVPGFEIPGEMFLPLKNGRWPRLCQKAGKAAGTLISMPLSAIIPVKQVEDVVTGAIGGLAQTFSGYFCDSGSASGLNFPDKVPDVPIPDDVRFEENIPKLDKARECDSVEQSAAGDPGTGGYAHTADNLTRQLTDAERREREDHRQAATDAKNKICQAAAEELALSQMADDGGPTGTDPDGVHKSMVTGDECGYRWSDSNFYRCPADCRQTNCEQFRAKVNGAYETCRPGATQGITAYNYQRRDLHWEVELEPMPGCNDDNNCRYNVRYVTPEPVTQQNVGVKSKRPPCGRGGEVGEDYVSTGYRPDGRYAEGEYLCSAPHNYVDPSEFRTSSGAAMSGFTLAALNQSFGFTDPDNSGWTLTRDASGNLKLIGEWSAVTYVHSCDRLIKSTGDIDRKMPESEKPPTRQQNECEDSQDNVHLEMEDATADNVLGGKTYQIRAIALRREPDTFAREVVQKVPMRLRGQQESDGTNPLSAAGALLRKVFAAQAEYYYDTTYHPHDDQWDQTETDRKEWTWHMYWKGRLRRLRFMDDGDEESKCAGQWDSQGTRPKNKPQDKCNNGGGGGGDVSSVASGGLGGLASSFIDPDKLAAETESTINDKLDSVEVPTTDVGGLLQQAGGGLEQLNVPGVGGGQQQTGGSGQSSACGSVSATRQLESLMIH